MPVYEFICPDCGPFDVARPAALAAAGADCPACGSAAARVFSAPRLALLARPTRRALDLEERSAHEPEVVTAKRGRPMPHHHHHHAPKAPWVLSH
jgi:putative FmdB family regulatory protein